MVWFIAIDGDDVGKILEKYILLNDILAIREISSRIESILEQFENKLNSAFKDDREYSIILHGGDNVLFSVSDGNLKRALWLISNYFFSSKLVFTVSVGVAMSPRDSYVALKFAKSIGKNVIVSYENSSFRIVDPTKYLNQSEPHD